MNKTLGALLLVAGTTIGAGMLALPTVTGEAGLFPTLLLFIFYWLFLGFTSLLVLEVNLWMGSQANMISMAKKTLGPLGELIAWGAYLFLLYALTTAYLAGSGPIVTEFINTFWGWQPPDWVGFMPLLAIFCFFVVLGMSWVDAINRLMMIGLGVAFLFMVATLFPHIEWTRLEHRDFTALPLAISVVATSFGFHIIIPSLTEYLDRDVKKIKRALIGGSLIPLASYFLWEVVSLGLIPLEGKWGIREGLAQGSSGSELMVHLLSEAVQSSLIVHFTRLFSFFAIVTSFLGVSLSLSSCLRDGLHLRQVKTPVGLVDALTFIPPLLIALIDPRAFLSALELAGVFGVIFLLAFLPALMVWSGRYRRHYSSALYQAPGGKFALGAVAVISLFLILLEIHSRTNL